MKTRCLGCGCWLYGTQEGRYPICIDCFVCPECGESDPWGVSSPVKKCPKCHQELPGQVIETINLTCTKCKKVWKTEKAYVKRYKQRIKFVKKFLKENKAPLEKWLSDENRVR